MKTYPIASDGISQEEKIFAEQAIVEFVRGTACRDVYTMNFILHDDFHALISETDNAAVSKYDYMKLLNAKVIGGEDVDVEIISLDVASDKAVAKVRITGENVVEVYYHLIQEINGSWLLLHVFPFRFAKKI